jgi:molybdopterin synthase sulfur carrier subunit
VRRAQHVVSPGAPSRTIRTYTGEAARRIDDAPADVRELLTMLAARYGTTFRRAVFAGAGLNPEVIILVSGRNVLHLKGLDTPLDASDEISIFPMVAGG